MDTAFTFQWGQKMFDSATHGEASQDIHGFMHNILCSQTCNDQILITFITHHLKESITVFPGRFT